jgi:hypothetical protein
MRAAVYTRVSTASRRRRGDDLTFIQQPEVQAEPLRNLTSGAAGLSHAFTPTELAEQATHDRR